MPQQKLELGNAAQYVNSPGIVRSSAITDQARTVYLKGLEWKITASFRSRIGGQYNKNCSVSEEHEVTISHNIDQSEATLVIQRFVKAVKVTGAEFSVTTGLGYLKWADTQMRPIDANTVQAFCESKFLPLTLQDDGPRGMPGKIYEQGNMQFMIHDAPGLHLSTPAKFPVAFLMGFIVRITVQPTDNWPPYVAEFPYRSYFEVLADPYSDEFRASRSIPNGLAPGPIMSFDDIDARYTSSGHRALDAAPIVAAVPARFVGGGAGKPTGGRPRRNSG